MEKREILFKDVLKIFLEENNLTQTKFAQTVGIQQSQVSEWLKGKASPGFYMLRQICLAFNVSADYFLGLTNVY